MLCWYTLLKQQHVTKHPGLGVAEQQGSDFPHTARQGDAKYGTAAAGNFFKQRVCDRLIWVMVCLVAAVSSGPSSRD